MQRGRARPPAGIHCTVQTPGGLRRMRKQGERGGAELRWALSLRAFTGIHFTPYAMAIIYIFMALVSFARLHGTGQNRRFETLDVIVLSATCGCLLICTLSLCEP